jgi:spore coat protein CotH
MINTVFKTKINYMKPNSIILIALIMLAACRKNVDSSGSTGTIGTAADSLTYNSDWTYTTHGNATTDYATVFPQSTVNTMEITIGSAKWSAVRTNMKSLFGYDFGANAGVGGSFPSVETDYVDVTVKYNNKKWLNVGYRLKGNSSLAQAWGQGNYKLPFKLNFDKFEDTYAAVTNQHFYGFEELSFSPSFRDQSLMREKLAADIFRLGGVPAAQTAFYRVYVDFGAGLKYCGVYTAVEVPDDNMFKNQLGEESGNMYKPESKLTSFVLSEFEKKNNETAANYTDVQNFISYLNAGNRTSNAVLWRQNLESVFNMNYYLKYLAINNAIVNWDTYGSMAHNYYLYNHSTDKLIWVPWDHNEALSGSPGITGTASGGGMNRTGLSLSMNEVTAQWPLLRYVADDSQYMNQYKQYLKTFNSVTFTQTAMDALIDKYYSMIEPYAIGTNGEQTGYTYLTGSSTFTAAKNELKTHVASRKSLISTYVP